jgi:hypothetical protein
MRVWLRLTGLFGVPDEAKSTNIACTSIGFILRADADDLVHGPLPEQLTRLLRQIAQREYELSTESQRGLADPRVDRLGPNRPTNRLPASRSNAGAAGHVPMASVAAQC